MSIAPRLRWFLDAHGVRYEIRPHPRSSNSAETAQLAHVPLDALAKPVLLEDELGYVMAIVPASRSVDLRNLSDQLHGRLNPGLASALKLFCSELNQRLSEAGHAALGSAAQLLPGGSTAPERDSWAYRMLYDRCLTIAGGTSEVQRGVIAQRVLGLPR